MDTSTTVDRLCHLLRPWVEALGGDPTRGWGELVRQAHAARMASPEEVPPQEWVEVHDRGIVAIIAACTYAYWGAGPTTGPAWRPNPGRIRAIDEAFRVALEAAILRRLPQTQQLIEQLEAFPESPWGIAEVAEYTGLTPSAISAYISRGTIPTPLERRASGPPEWHPDAIRAWNASRRKRPSRKG